MQRCHNTSYLPFWSVSQPLPYTTPWTRFNHRGQPLLIETTLLVKILDVESEIFGEEHVKDHVHIMCVLCAHVYFQQDTFKCHQVEQPIDKRMTALPLKRPSKDCMLLILSRDLDVACSCTDILKADK